jgi:hypothetical protein
MKTYGGSGGIDPPFLISAVDGGPGPFIPVEVTNGTYRIGSWVGPRAILDAVEERERRISCSSR